MLKKLHAKLLQSCPTLCDPMDSSPPGSPIHGTLQASTLEWVAISFSLNHLQLTKKRIFLMAVITLTRLKAVTEVVNPMNSGVSSLIEVYSQYSLAL